MTEPDRLSEIEARWQRATPGPWMVNPRSIGPVDDPVIQGPDGTYVAQTSYDTQSWSCKHDVAADTVAIAAAPDDIAWLIAEVRRLRGLYA